MFGKDDWKDFKAVEEEANTLQTAAATLQEVHTNLNRKVEEAGESINTATDTTALKGAHESLSNVRETAVKTVNGWARRARALKAVVTKQLKSKVEKVQTVEFTSDGKQQTVALISMYMTDSLCAQNGDFINSAAYSEISSDSQIRPPYHVSGMCVKELVDSAMYKGLQKWLSSRLQQRKSQSQDQDVVISSLDRPQYMKCVKDFVEQFGSNHFPPTETTTIKQEFVSMYRPQLVLYLKEHTTTGFLPFSAAETYVCLTGHLLMYGLPVDDLPGYSYSSKRDAFFELKPEELATFAGGNHTSLAVANLKPGSLFHAPAGYIWRKFAKETTTALKWSYFGGCPQETKKVLANALLFAASHPELAQGMFNEWLSFLQVKASQKKDKEEVPVVDVG